MGLFYVALAVLCAFAHFEPGVVFLSVAAAVIVPVFGDIIHDAIFTEW